MPKIIGKEARVVEFKGLSIDELAGNVATSEDTISIAYVTISEPTAEPWLTLGYDEWLCVRKGYMDLHFMDGETEKVLTVRAGETCMVSKGERFRPVFPEPNVEYIPVCLPAFRPDRCIREEDSEEPSDVVIKLKELHNTEKPCYADPEKYKDVDVIYHMCQKSLWDQAVASGNAYVPPTFETDGLFTHSTAVPQRLIETANHFYTATKGDWICLKLSRLTLQHKFGIITKFEQSMPVGESDVGTTWGEWVCPHIYGAIPTAFADEIVTATYPMSRSEDGTFLSITGLTDNME
jgi:uncharacterized protein (DUF952 family)